MKSFVWYSYSTVLVIDKAYGALSLTRTLPLTISLNLSLPLYIYIYREREKERDKNSPKRIYICIYI